MTFPTGRAALTRLRDAEAGDFTRLPTPDGEGQRQSAVLVLFGEQPDSGPDILVLQRAATMRNHAGQPAFPGGAVDPTDIDTIACALREAEEEVGLDPATVEVVATLPTLWIPVSNFLVTPVVAWWRSPHPVGPADPAEVARVERLPIRDLIDPANRLRVRHPSGWIGPAFRIHDMLVWASPPAWSLRCWNSADGRSSGRQTGLRNCRHLVPPP